MKRIRPEEVTALVNSMLKKYEPLIISEAAKQGVDPQLIAAVMKQESLKAAALQTLKKGKEVDPASIKSPAGAVGLLQMIPDTAKRFGVKDSTDPAENIRGGVAYLKWLNNRFGGDTTKVLAGYNAGEGSVDKYGGVPPFAETVNYVNTIMADLQKTYKENNTGGDTPTPPPANIVEPNVSKAVTTENKTTPAPPVFNNTPSTPNSTSVVFPSVTKARQLLQGVQDNISNLSSTTSPVVKTLTDSAVNAANSVQPTKEEIAAAEKVKQAYGKILSSGITRDIVGNATNTNDKVSGLLNPYINAPATDYAGIIASTIQPLEQQQEQNTSLINTYLDKIKQIDQTRIKNNTTLYDRYNYNPADPNSVGSQNAALQARLAQRTANTILAAEARGNNPNIFSGLRDSLFGNPYLNGLKELGTFTDALYNVDTKANTQIATQLGILNDRLPSASVLKNELDARLSLVDSGTKIATAKAEAPLKVQELKNSEMTQKLAAIRAIAESSANVTDAQLRSIDLNIKAMQGQIDAENSKYTGAQTRAGMASNLASLTKSIADVMQIPEETLLKRADTLVASVKTDAALATLPYDIVNAQTKAENDAMKLKAEKDMLPAQVQKETLALNNDIATLKNSNPVLEAQAKNAQLQASIAANTASAAKDGAINPKDLADFTAKDFALKAKNLQYETATADQKEAIDAQRLELARLQTKIDIQKANRLNMTFAQASELDDINLKLQKAQASFDMRRLEAESGNLQARQQLASLTTEVQTLQAQKEKILLKGEDVNKTLETQVFQQNTANLRAKTDQALAQYSAGNVNKAIELETQNTQIAAAKNAVTLATMDDEAAYAKATLEHNMDEIKYKMQNAPAEREAARQVTKAQQQQAIEFMQSINMRNMDTKEKEVLLKQAADNRALVDQGMQLVGMPPAVYDNLPKESKQALTNLTTGNPLSSDIRTSVLAAKSLGLDTKVLPLAPNISSTIKAVGMLSVTNSVAGTSDADVNVKLAQRLASMASPNEMDVGTNLRNPASPYALLNSKDIVQYGSRAMSPTSLNLTNKLLGELDGAKTMQEIYEKFATIGTHAEALEATQQYISAGVIANNATKGYSVIGIPRQKVVQNPVYVVRSLSLGMSGFKDSIAPAPFGALDSDIYTIKPSE